MYDLAFVEPGPLPPHERSWRHPSELGPTRHDVVDETGHHRAAFALGTLAVLAVAGLVIAMTPRATSSPTALNATTMPPAILRAPATTVESSPAPVQPTSERAALVPMDALFTSFAAFPHSVAPRPQISIDGTDIAATVPTPEDDVLVHTDDVTYELPWGQVPLLDVPNGTVVFTLTGELVAHLRADAWVMLAGE